MTALRSAGAAGHFLPAGQLPRLVAPGGPLGLEAHAARYGSLPPAPAGPAGQAQLIGAVERSGLAGRGGAAFPAARKMRAVTGAAARRGRRRGGTVLIANGAGSEPASGKDAILLRQSPHLVLDGIALAAAAVGGAAPAARSRRPAVSRAATRRDGRP